MRQILKTFGHKVSIREVHTSSRFDRRNVTISLLVGGTLTTFAAILWLTRSVRRKKSEASAERYFDPNMKGLNDGMYKLRGVWMSPLLIESEKSWLKINTFDVRDSDIFILSYPKSGTTWIQEIVYLVATGLDFESEKIKNIEERCPFLEYPVPGVDAISSMPDTRFIKSHLPLQLMPKALLNAKVIYIARDAKDTAVSFYHFMKGMTMVNYTGTFDDFCESFIEGKLGYGTWWNHVNSFWLLRHHPRVLFVTYEELHKDVRKVIKEVGKFLGKDLTSGDIDKIAEHCSFTAMKHNPSVNYEWMKEQGLLKKSSSFIRKGVVGDWKNYFSENMATRFDDNTQQLHKETGFTINYKDS